MRLDVHVHIHDIEPGSASEILARLDHLRDLIVKNQEKIMATLDEVLVEVTDESTRLDSIGTMISGIQQQLADALAGTTLPPAVQAKVDAVFDGLKANSAKIDAALNSNVPPPTP